MVALHYPSLSLFAPYAGEAGVEELIVEARRLDHSLCARREPRARFAVHHYDCDGATATSDLPLLRGEHVMLRFPARPGRTPWKAFGRVLSCEADDGGYRVSVGFDPLPAA